jgi:LmbE family N-acetylglucosaminyl deacetylase
MNILVIAAHPDDEVLGCGGTIARLSGEGFKVSVVILGEGIASRYTDRDESESERKLLHANCKKASDLLGVTNLQIHNLPDNQFDMVSLLTLAKIIEGEIKKWDPVWIYTHHHSDLNIDHTLTNKATLIATRPVEGNKVRRLFSYEVPSSTEWSFGTTGGFQPNSFMDISNTMERKIEALKIYEGEVRRFPHPRSPESLRAIAMRWGSVSGLHAAEAFELVREVW